MSVPLLLTQQRSFGFVGDVTLDTAILEGYSDPTGEIRFRLYGPDDPTCAGPAIFVAPPVLVHGNGAYRSAHFPLARPGRYRWVAEYSGDCANLPGSEECDAE